MPLRRHLANPILTRDSVPPVRPHLKDVSAVFNPGAAWAGPGELGNRIVLLLRVQNRGRETYLVRAESEPDPFGPTGGSQAPRHPAGGDADAGAAAAPLRPESHRAASFRVAPGAVPIHGLERLGRVYHAYDPRITRLEGSWFVTLALDVDDGCRVALARTDDFRELELLGLVSPDDSRNGVLFPERIGGRYALLERPNRPAGELATGAATGETTSGVPAARERLTGDPASGDAIVLSYSDDLRHWQRSGVVACGRPRYWDERIGPGTPPVKTRAGWLLLYHGVATHFASVNLYQAGALLLDLEDPSRLVARTRYNLLEPRAPYETVGQVPNVVFPSGWVVESFDEEGFARPESRVLVFYGAADTVVGLAATTIGELLDDCREGA